MSADIEPAPPPAAAPPPDSARSTAWCSKMLGFLCRNRNRVNPGRVELPDCDFVNVAPGRTLRVLRPELKSDRYYEAPTPNNRPESINDNFYARWARRPHPSGNCRCSFRQSSNSNRLSSTEEKLLSRIRTSLCEAEKTGTDIRELERSLAVDLSQLEAPAESEPPQEDEEAPGEVEQIRSSKLEPLGESVKQRIVKDLDKYISALLDEILSDTIRAIVRADNPFDRAQQQQQQQPAAAFDINFSFHSSDDGQKGERAKEQPEGEERGKGYVNRGFVGSASDPDALDFDLRHGVNNGAILETADCIDSGINSVETIELQPEQEQNLEQSLIDIIDAKLGGASIGKSLEDLRTEIDDTDKARTPKAKEPEAVEAEKPAAPEPEEPAAVEEEVKKSKPEEKRVTIKEPPVSSPADRTSASLDNVAEQPAFNSLRLEFRRPKPSKDSAADSKSTSSSVATSSGSVSSRVNKTMSAIRQRLAIRLGGSPRKQHAGANGKSSGSSSSGRSSTRSALELEDYRRRFPVPESRHRHQFKYDGGEEAEVVLRNRKPTLVFLHGFGSSADAFEPQLRYFASLGYPCVAPDLLGHGLSTAPSRGRDYQFARLLEDLETVLLQYAFKPGQKCVIVAHNYGCSFATALAQKYVSSVHQLVLISGGGPTPLAPPPAEGSFRCFLRGLLAPLLFCGMQRAILYAPRGRHHPYCGGELEEDQRPSHMRHVLSGMAWPEGDYVFHRRICTPTLLVHGLRDNLVSLVQECQMERTMVKAFLEAIPAAGHMPMTDCPEQLNHMIHCFIDLWKNKKW